jgi:hypothetical protein
MTSASRYAKPEDAKHDMTRSALTQSRYLQQQAGTVPKILLFFIEYPTSR